MSRNLPAFRLAGASRNLTSQLLLSFPAFRWAGIFILLVSSSCVSNKKYIYLQNKSGSTGTTHAYKQVNTEYKLKPGDILYIRLVTEDEKMNALFNPLTSGNMNMQMMMNQAGGGTPFYILGYSLDKDGDLELPYMGKLHLKDKTVEDAKELMRIEASKYFKNFFLQVKIAEFRFSILGAVNRPGQFFFMVNHLNIFEALAMSGDVNEIAKRTNLTLLRQDNGETKLYNIDLTDKNILTSPYYLIQPNDIIYVQPIKSRSVGNLSSFQLTLSTVLPIFSTFLTVLNTYIILTNLK